MQTWSRSRRPRRRTGSIVELFKPSPRRTQALAQASSTVTSQSVVATWATALDNPAPRRTAGPPWASLDGPGHCLYTLGGIVGCSRCGGCAQLNIAKSLLSKQCRRYVVSHNNFGMLVRGRLPTTFRKYGWPDGGEEVRNGFGIAKLQPE